MSVSEKKSISIFERNEEEKKFSHEKERGGRSEKMMVEKLFNKKTLIQLVFLSL
jgi:hypothetical protein